MGGLLKLWAVPASVVVVTGKTVSFTETTNIYEIYCTPGTIDENEVLREENRNPFYETAINGFIPKDSPGVQTALMDMKGKPYVLIYQNGNEDYKLAGTRDFPLRLTNKLASGKTEAQRAGNNIAFVGKTLTPAVFIDKPF